MKPYPKILSEDVTIDLAQKVSIARFGDGEWRCALGNGCTSQRADEALARELQRMLLEPRGCLVCIPNALESPRRDSWLRYTEDRYVKYCGASTYGSSFITRPDNAPWIDRPDYWAKVRDLWIGQDIILVTGDKKSLTVEMIGAEAKSVREVFGPRQHAYSDIERLEDEITGGLSGRVLLCLGTTATVLAYRLAMRDIHAIDLGHIGMFLKHAGAYRYAEDDLTSPLYRKQIERLHRKQRWGADGEKHLQAVHELIDTYGPKTILDYGCGQNRLAAALAPIRVSGYDPGIPERAKMPKPCELVICTDVLEHVEPEKLSAVLDHLFRVTGKAAYCVISTRPAKAVLPDGRNAHLIVEDADWWLERLIAVGWRVARCTHTAKDLRAWLEKP